MISLKFNYREEYDDREYTTITNLVELMSLSQGISLARAIEIARSNFIQEHPLAIYFSAELVFEKEHYCKSEDKWEKF